MIANKVALLTATAALLEQAVAVNPHRHLHNQIQKRALHTDWVTVWETIVVTAGQESVPVATEAPAVEYQQPEINNGVPTTTSTTVLVVPTAPAPVQKEKVAPVQKEQAAPAQEEKPTTLAQVIKPSKIVADVKAKVPATTTKAPAATTAASSSGGGSAGFSHKRGLAYNNIDMAESFASSCSNCGWGYNWDSESYGLNSKLNYIPMLWDDTETHTSRFTKNVEEALSNGAKAIFSFNEPDNGGQANMDAGRAASSHVKLLNKYAGKALIGAPCITNSGDAGEGLEWLQSFVTACDSLDEKCHYDFCNVHWYSEVQYGETLFEHLDKAHKLCGNKPIWLTEFAPHGSDEAVGAWIKEAIPRLEALEYLDAYSYFMVGEGSLMASTSELSSNGKIYASA